jgi:hypothetical protein
MPGFDDRLTRELERVASPEPPPPELFREVDRRRGRRALVRKAQAAGLAIVVLLGTGGGVVALNHVFRTGGSAPGTSVTPVVTPETSAEPTQEPTKDTGRDIGLDFNVCSPNWLGGMDFAGDGTHGGAWTAVLLKDDGTCPRFAKPNNYLLAVDYTGDRLADSWLDLPFDCYVGCAPFDATDLDGDGSEELVVTSYFSIMDYYLFSVRPNPVGELQVEPILVADPGHEPAGITAGLPLRIDAGGDEGYGSSITCEGYPSAPVIVWSSSYAPVESNVPKEVHVTRIQLQSDGLFHVVGTNDYTVPAGEPSGINNETGPACGVDWHPLP